MSTVRVMNWNIQNFGVLKSRMNDIVLAISEVVVQNNVDIFSVIEINTTKNSDAIYICEVMLLALQEAAARKNRAGEFKSCILSYNTGLEYYAFFIRDIDSTVPLVCTKGADSNGIVKDVTAATFAPCRDTGVTIGFPLLKPDTAKDSYLLRGLPHWPGARLPALGLFSVPGTTNCSELLPIVACHLIPKTASAAGQIDTLRYFHLFNGLANTIPAPAPAQLQVDDGTGAVTAYLADKLVLLGDLNVNCLDWPMGACASLANLGAVCCIGATTHLVDYHDYRADPRRYKTPASLVTNAYDNIFLLVGPTIAGAVTAANGTVVMTPELVKERKLSLNESVEYYRDLDNRGFDSGEYKSIVVDFAQQLAGDPSHYINIPATLLGTRLISDHLPNFADITLT